MAKSYLFFDTECANCFEGKGKICSFGYVLTDGDFNVLEKDDILINPAAPFDVRGFKMRGLELAYPFDTFRKQKRFPYYYDKIRALITEKDRVIVGHNTRSDASYLYSDTERYHLPPINFCYVDTQELVSSKYDRHTALHLEDIFRDLVGEDDSIRSHSSVDDAYMTMCVARAVARSGGRGLEAEARAVPACRGEVFMGRFIVGDTVFGFRPDNLTKGKNAKLLSELASHAKGGKPRITLSKTFEENNFLESVKIISEIMKKGWSYSKVVNHGGTFVKTEEAEDGRFRKNHRARGVKIISLEDLLAMLGLKRKDVKITTDDADDIFGALPEHKDWYDKYKRQNKRTKRP